MASQTAKQVKIQMYKCNVSRKYSDLHHGGNWKFRRGQGLIGLGNSSRLGRLKTKIHFRHVQRLFLTDLCESFWCFRWSYCVFPTMLRLKTAFLFHKSFFLSRLVQFWTLSPLTQRRGEKGPGSFVCACLR